MVILLLEKVPKSLRGEITRWLIELDTGVFVGRISALVRDLLWEKVVATAGSGRCAMAYRIDRELGFAMRLHNYTDRVLQDFDRLTLITVRNAEAIRKAERLEREIERLRRRAERTQQPRSGPEHTSHQ